MKHLIKTSIATITLSLASFCTQASVIDYTDIAGLRTFQDTNTGRVWLDMDNFFDAAATNGTSGNDMISIAQGAGFTFAAQSDVEQLLNTLPLDGGQWSSYAPIMGYGIPRQLIWGMFDDGANPYGYAWAWSASSSWSYLTDATDANIIQNAGSSGAVDMGIWAYRDNVSPVPVPAAVWLFGSGLMGLLGFNRKRAQSAA